MSKVEYLLQLNNLERQGWILSERCTIHDSLEKIEWILETTKHSMEKQRQLYLKHVKTYDPNVDEQTSYFDLKYLLHKYVRQ
jgi:hypothetical protein